MTLRATWLLAGVAWAGRSLLETVRPNYYEPATLLDWSAVLSYSAAWLLSALAVLVLARAVRTAPVHALGIIFAIAATVAGVANAVEDGLDLSWAGLPYLVGFLVAWIMLLPFAIAVWRSGPRILAALPGALFGSIALFPVGGGLIVLVVAAAFVVTSGRRRDP